VLRRQEFNESEQSPLGKGRLYSHRPEHAQSVKHWSRDSELPKGSGSWISAAAMGRPPAGGATRSEVLGVDIAQNLVEAGNRRTRNKA
jgi:hypothetical protein